MSAIPVGYKQTEVGVIPQDWEVARISSVSRSPVQNGVFNEPARKGRGCKLINVGDLYTAAPIDINNLEKFDATKMEVSKFGVTHGDLFFTRSSITPDGIAYCNIYDQTTHEDIVFDCHIIRVQADNKKVDPFFLARFCVTKPARIYLVANAKTTTMTTVDQAVIGGLPVPLPPLPEQRAIAAALSDVDDLLAKLDQFIAKKRDLKQAAMQQLLTGQTRLPGFSGEWEVKRLGNVAIFLKGKGLPKSALVPFGAEPCIHYGELFTRYPETIGAIISRTNNSRDTFRSVANDVLMPTSDVTPRGLAKASCVTVDDVILGGDILVIRTDRKRICGTFLSYVIRREEEQVLQLVTGSTVFHLYGSDMKKFTFSMPLLPEQTAIATVLSNMDAELAALEARRDKTRALKQGMMQELLTGRIRLV
jgi:type I restriction enzyme S subunit